MKRLEDEDENGNNVNEDEIKTLIRELTSDATISRLHMSTKRRSLI